MFAESAQRLVGSWGWKGVSEPLVQTLLRTSPIGGLLQLPLQGAHHCLSWSSSDSERPLCGAEISDHGRQGRFPG